MTKLRLAAPRPGRAPLLALLLVAATTLWHPWTLDSGTQPDAPTYWLPVRPQLLEQQLGLVGRIQAVRQETLTAPFDGLIREVLTHEGQSVAADQVLLRLDPGQIEIQLRQAQAELLKAQRQIHQLRNWESSPEVSRARRARQTAHATLQATQANLRDTRALLERGIVARMEVDTLVQQVRAQQQDLLTAQEELRAVEARRQGEERKIAEMEWVNAQARHQALSVQSERQVLKAPFAGIAVRPTVPEGGKVAITQPGLQVSQGAALVTVIGLDRIQVLTKVEETDLHLLHEGMPVQISADGFAEQTLNGRIAAIAVQGHAADSPGAAAHYDVVVSVDAPTDTKQQRRLGMSARLAVILYRNAQGIAVPPQSLRTDDQGTTYVLYRATPDATPTKVLVKPGRAIAQGIEVQGLQAGYVQVHAP